MRLGTVRKVGNDGNVIDRLVQIAASSKNEVATLDASGIVHVFDVRMSDRSPGNIGEVTSFSACNYVGIGLESMPTSNGDETRWVTWGLDSPQSDAVVRVWSDGATSSAKTEDDADSYWYMDGSPTTSPKTSIASNKSAQIQYHQVADFSTPYLACARVCPEPFGERIVTVGMIPGKRGDVDSAWQAQAWKLQEGVEKHSFDGDYRGVEMVASFEILANDGETSSMLGTNAKIGQLRGAELALEASRVNNRFRKDGDEDISERDGLDLLLCCLSDEGYVTTHVSEGNHQKMV